jgi:hypothetical protein
MQPRIQAKMSSTSSTRLSTGGLCTHKHKHARLRDERVSLSSNYDCDRNKTIESIRKNRQFNQPQAVVPRSRYSTLER